MAYISTIEITNDNSYLIEPTLYIAPSKNGAAYTATLTNFSLATGVTVQAKFAATNDANATLNVNSTGAKEIHYNGTKITASQFKANHVYTLVYDGTQWQVVGDIDTNTNTWRGIQNVLTSDSTTDSLSAKQGKVLKGLIDAMDATTPAASGNATAFIDSITQTDGKITSITKKNIPVVSKDTAGLAPKGAAVSAQSTSTQFLREDGTWAAPSYIADTHHTAHLITGASATATANAAGDTNSIFLNLIENDSVRNSHNIIGAGSVTVASDADGKITITGDNAIIHNSLLKNKGDIIYASDANTPARLAIGSTAGQVLAVSSDGIPAWASSGSANALTSLKLKYTDSSAHDDKVGNSSSVATALGTVTNGVLYIKSLYYGATSVSTGVIT